MKKILYPTDFSDVSLNAYRFALRLVKNSDAELVTIHVYDFPMQPFYEDHDFIMKTYNIKEWGDFENFRSEVPRLRIIAEKVQLGLVKVSHMLERGYPVIEILRAIKNEQPDVVVMGTKGASGFRKVFLGTVTQRIMEKSAVVVLAVPAACRYKPFKNILYLTHYDKVQMDLLYRLHNFALLFNAHIDVLQVKDHHDHLDSILLGQWKDHFAGNNISFDLEVSQSFEKTILETVAVKNIDLLSFHILHKGVFEKVFSFSLARDMAFSAKVPILSIPP